MGRRKFPLNSYDQINVTPLIDTLFFLLVIFMITAPLLEYSIDVSPPKMTTASEIKPDENTKVINIKRNGEILFEKKTVSMNTLLARLSEIKKLDTRNKCMILLRGDSELKYGIVIDVLKTIKNAGFTNINLVTESEK